MYIKFFSEILPDDRHWKVGKCDGFGFLRKIIMRKLCSGLLEMTYHGVYLVFHTSM